MLCFCAVALISAHFSSLTRTDCTQASSSAPKPSSAVRAIPPTVPPGFLGVEVGEPTVPKRKGDLGMGGFLWITRITETLRRLRALNQVSTDVQRITGSCASHLLIR